MAEDFTNEIFLKTLIEVIEKKEKDGVPERKIQQFLETDALADMYYEVIKVISDSAVNTIEDIMYEKVLFNRAKTEEFVS